jgi:hypothetical protein
MNNLVNIYKNKAQLENAIRQLKSMRSATNDLKAWLRMGNTIIALKRQLRGFTATSTCDNVKVGG